MFYITGISTSSSTLRRLLKAKPLSRFIETHSPISAMIANDPQRNFRFGVIFRKHGST